MKIYLAIFLIDFDCLRITVKFNINGSLDDSEPHVDEQMELEKSKNEADPPQVANFLILIMPFSFHFKNFSNSNY
jgi:hypothetical protein